MRLMVIAAAVILSSGPGAAAQVVPIGDMPTLDPNASSPSNCPPTSRFDATGRDKRLQPDKLTDLPAADHYKAVWRRIGGCDAPIIAGFSHRATQSRQPSRR